ncbi:MULTISPECIES: hypothetical protein [unclassified Sphingomonas]|uniref:hypothetical protein n=1 Tax=unclassified Sphingomonas TaxID=196159 RepID=UPI0009274D83|nr:MULTISPECIES: hypothetical protein [unclassified Sphingomonas]MBN8849527.1 hypothetical protein [Sphingomonas sp.]OJV34612.1 MAG: hypothetical protein BGO24_13200 [Sphingomonas sp. 67-36]
MNRAVVFELLWLVAALTITALIFWAGAWSYPQGAGTIWPIGWATMAAVLAMSLYEIRRVWTRGREIRDN